MVSGKVKWKWLTTIERRFLPPAEPDLTDFYVQYRLQGNAEHVTYEVESPDFSFGPIM
jgi:hypothetical protein